MSDRRVGTPLWCGLLAGSTLASLAYCVGATSSGASFLSRCEHAGVHFWLIGAALLVTVLGGAITSRRFCIYREARRRLREGRCLYCDYDLTDNVSGTCPECGRGIDQIVGRIAQ